MPRSKKLKRARIVSREKIIARLIVLGVRARFMVKEDVSIGNSGDTADLVWESAGEPYLSFVICDQMGIHKAFARMEAAYKQWACKTMLILENPNQWSNALWLADQRRLGQFQAVLYEDIGGGLRRRKDLQKWLGV